MSKYLQQNGIFGITALRLANQEYMTMDYAKAHIEYGKRRKDKIALVIYRMQNHDPMPEVYDSDKRKLDSEGKWGEYFRH